MFARVPQLDSPLFPHPGRSACMEFRALESAQRLDPRIWTAGYLSAPHKGLLRSEVCRYRSELRHNEKSGTDSLVRTWFGLRFDALELGRILYHAQIPKSGEPSWREAGAVALEHLLVEFHKLARPNPIASQEMLRVLEKVSIRAALFGQRFGPGETLSGSDLRFSYIRLSWISDAVSLDSCLWLENTVINRLMSELQISFSLIKQSAAERFPPGRDLYREAKILPLSRDEMEMAGIDPNEVRELHKLSAASLIPDCIPAEREGLERVGLVSDTEPDADVVPPESVMKIGSAEGLNTESLAETLLSIDFRREEVGILELRQNLKAHGLALAAAPDPIDSTRVPYLIGTADGLEILLRLAPVEEYSTPREAADALVVELFGKTSKSELGDLLELMIIEVSNSNGELQSLLEIRVRLPRDTLDSAEMRHQLLEDLEKVLVDTKEYFV